MYPTHASGGWLYSRGCGYHGDPGADVAESEESGEKHPGEARRPHGETGAGTRTCCIYPVGMSLAAVRQPPAAERVYTHVKQGVLERRYEGGTLLTEGELAEAVGVSRTPVREALLRLEAEGLLRLYPKKGALVLPVSAQEIADVVETRLLVEEHAARKAVPAPAGLIERLEELLARQK